jgi:hypothetical protein
MGKCNKNYSFYFLTSLWKDRKPLDKREGIEYGRGPEEVRAGGIETVVEG